MKKIYQITVALIFLIILCRPVFGQENLTFLKNWESYPVPTDEDSLNKYKDENQWFVYFDGDEVRVDDFRYHERDPEEKLPFKVRQSKSKRINYSAPLAGLIDAIEVEDGYLVGFNRGEWCGELYWFSKNGKKKYQISKHQIEQFIKRDNKIYAIEGVAHLTMSYGSIIEIKKILNKWVAKTFLKLPTAPNAIQLDSKDDFIVVTTRTGYSTDERGHWIVTGLPGLFSIDRKANIDTLVKVGMWDSFYATSMVIQNDVVYIGTRKGVYKFDLATRKEEWLLPPKKDEADYEK